MDIFDLVEFVCFILGGLIAARAISTWFTTRRDHPILRFLDDVTEPLLAPLRRIIPQSGGVDFTPMVAILLLLLVVPLLLDLLRESA